jgi:hypothetical protein
MSTRGGPPAWRLSEGLTTPHHKIPNCYDTLHRASDPGDSCEHGNEPSGTTKGGNFMTGLCAMELDI